MDNKAQLTIEYMVIISLLMGIAALVSLVASNFFGLKQQTAELNEGLTENLKGMWEV